MSFPDSKFSLLVTILIIANIVMLRGEQFQVLLFTEAEGYHHQSIADGVQAMRKLSEKHNFGLHWTENSKIFSDSSLYNYDVVVFLNTGGNVLTKEEQKGLQKFYRKGNGFVGIHGAAATELEWNWFGKLIGRRFIIHPTIQTAKVNIKGEGFPATYHLPDKMLWTEEWYEFGPELSNNLKYLITVDETTYNPKAKWEDKKGDGMGKFHPIAWYQKFEGGRAFYTGLGHIGVAFRDRVFLEHIYGGIYWSSQGE